MKGDKLYMNPNEIELVQLCQLFDVYLVGNDSLFMLLPLTSTISSTRKSVRNAQVALMIGDVLPQALWVAKEENYDLLYGWLASDITIDRVESIRGHVTIGHSYLEYYNSKESIPNNTLSCPLF